MDRDQTDKMTRGTREKAILRDLKAKKNVPISDLLIKHPKSSLHAVLKRIKKRGDGRYIKIKQGAKLVSAFQLKGKKAPSEEVEMLIKLVEGASRIDIMREAAKDLLALASTYKRFPDKAVDFLLNNWHSSRYGQVQRYLLRTLLRITVSAKAEDHQMLVKRIMNEADNFLKVVKNQDMHTEIREDAWRLLELLEDPRITATAFKILTYENETEGIMSFAKEEVKQYADENPHETKKRLYKILLESSKGTSKYQNVFYLLRAIRHSRRSESSTRNNKK